MYYNRLPRVRIGTLIAFATTMAMMVMTMTIAPTLVLKVESTNGYGKSTDGTLSREHKHSCMHEWENVWQGCG